MSICSNCGRELRGYVMGAETWLSLFCSPMCRDTAKELRKHERQKAESSMVCIWCGETFHQHDAFRPDNAPVPKVPCLGLQSHFAARAANVQTAADLDPRWTEQRNEPPASNCGVPNCQVCSGAMRERAGKGDDT